MLTYRELLILILGALIYDFVCAAVVPDLKVAKWFGRAWVPGRIIAYGLVMFLVTLLFIPLSYALLILVGALLVGGATYWNWRKSHPKAVVATPSKEA